MSHFARNDGRNRKLRVERLESREMLAGDLELVKDINTNTPGSSPRDFISVDSEFYFLANNFQELWRSNGTSNGTEIVKDFLAGQTRPDLLNAVSVGRRLYFLYRDASYAYQLWTSDGTESGTRVVKNIDLEMQTYVKSDIFVVSGNKLYFTAWDQNNGLALWTADESGGEPTLVKNHLEPNLQFAGNQWRRAPIRLVPFGHGIAFLRLDYLYASTSRNELYYSLWVSDGTAANTQALVSNIESANGLITIDGSLYFAEHDWYSGHSLWKSDGTAAGTVPFAGVNVKSIPLVIGSRFYFLGERPSGLNLWVSDGTPSGTKIVGELDDDVNALPELVNVSGVLYVSGERSALGRELWKLDGTWPWLQLVTDINTLPGYSNFQLSRGSYPRSLTNLNGTLYFFSDDGVTGAELWKSDGSVAGTIQVKDIRPGLAGSQYPTNSVALINHLGTLYFAADDEVHGSELWRSDGTPQGTTLIKDLKTDSLNSIRSNNPFFNLGGELIFTASNGYDDVEIWKSNGTPAGTVRVSNIRNGVRNDSYSTRESGLNGFTEMNGALYFRAIDVANDWELWRTNGTTASTFRVKDINSTSTSYRGSSDPQELVNVNGTLFFTADDGLHGRELWKSNGTPAGTVLVKDIAVGEILGSFPRQFKTSYLTALTNVNGVLFFIADDGVSGLELWRSDGTTAGTYQVKDLQPDGGIIGIGNRYDFRMYSVGSTAFFWATLGLSSGLWKSDGTAGGTQFVTDVYLRPYTSPVHDRFGHLYFAGYSSNDGASLFRIDRANGAVSLLVDPEPNVVDFGWSSLTDLTFVGDAIYFVFTSAFGTPELWKSDGTLAGTIKVSLPVKLSSIPRQASSVDTLYFNAQRGSYQSELWQTDGTIEGTAPMRLAGNVPLLNVTQTGQIGSRVFVAGYLSDVGAELFTIDLTKHKIGDYNGNDLINRFDHARWRTSFGATTGIGLSADGNGNGVVDAADYTIWRESIQPFPGDFDQNGAIDTTDHLFWRNYVGDTSGVGLAADANFDNVVDAADYTIWRDAYVPQPFTPDYNRDYKLTSADGTFWAANFGATTGIGLQADGNSNNIVDAADYTLWRDAFIRPAASEPTIAIASAAISSDATAKPVVARPIAGSPPRRTDLLLAAHDAAFAELGSDDAAPTRGEASHVRRASQPVGRLKPAAKLDGLKAHRTTCSSTH